MLKLVSASFSEGGGTLTLGFNVPLDQVVIGDSRFIATGSVSGDQTLLFNSVSGASLELIGFTYDPGETITLRYVNGSRLTDVFSNAGAQLPLFRNRSVTVVA